MFAIIFLSNYCLDFLLFIDISFGCIHDNIMLTFYSRFMVRIVDPSKRATCLSQPKPSKERQGKGDNKPVLMPYSFYEKACNFNMSRYCSITTGTRDRHCMALTVAIRHRSGNSLVTGSRTFHKKAIEFAW